MEKNKKDETEADAARPGRVLVSSAMKKKRPSLSLSLSLSLSPFVLSLIFFIFLIPLFIFVDFCWSFFPSFCFLLLAFRPPPVLSSIQASFTVVVYPEILSVILCGIFDNFSLSSFSSWNSFWIRKKKNLSLFLCFFPFFPPSFWISNERYWWHFRICRSMSTVSDWMCCFHLFISSHLDSSVSLILAGR